MSLRIKLFGDKEKAIQYIQDAMRYLKILKNAMSFNNLKQLSRLYQDVDANGGTIFVQSVYDQDLIIINIPSIIKRLPLEKAEQYLMILVYMQNWESLCEYEYDNAEIKTLTYIFDFTKSRLEPSPGYDITLNITKYATGMFPVAQFSPNASDTHYVYMANQYVYENAINLLKINTNADFWQWNDIEPICSGAINLIRGVTLAWRPAVLDEDKNVLLSDGYMSSLDARRIYKLDSNGLYESCCYQIATNQIGLGKFCTFHRFCYDIWTGINEYWIKYRKNPLEDYQDSDILATDYENGAWNEHGYNWRRHHFIAALSHDKAIIHKIERNCTKNYYGLASYEAVAHYYEKYEKHMWYQCAVEGEKLIYIFECIKEGDIIINYSPYDDTQVEQLYFGGTKLLDLTYKQTGYYHSEASYSAHPCNDWNLIYEDDCLPPSSLQKTETYGYFTLTSLLPSNPNTEHYWEYYNCSMPVYPYNCGHSGSMPSGWYIPDTELTEYDGDHDIYVQAFDNLNGDDEWICFYSYNTTHNSFFREYFAPNQNETNNWNIVTHYMMSYKLNNVITTEEIATSLYTRTQIKVSGSVTSDVSSYSGTVAKYSSCQINKNIMIWTYCLYEYNAYAELEFKVRKVTIIHLIKGDIKKYDLYDDDDRLVSFDTNHIAAIGVLSI